ncbi:MAG: hypothetical protein WBG50_12870 [Desulfomonilaceae bacterium]
MKMVLRYARKQDLSAIKKILKPWIDHDPEILELLENLPLMGEQSTVSCRILETDKSIRCVSLWSQEDPNEARLLALGLGPGTADLGWDRRFLREEILSWSEVGVAKATVRLPESLAGSLIDCLKSCGFMLEGISSCCSVDDKPQISLCKHFLYRVIPNSQVMDFLRDFLLSLGYEVRVEPEGLVYRIKPQYHLPFIFSSWHRITKSGPDIIVHPPARVLETHELETLFYPLRIHARHEQPLLLPMEKKRALHLIDLPQSDSRQNSLFDSGPVRRDRPVHASNLTYGYPTGVRGIRKGLPLLFYINKVGVVGSGRVEDWYLDEPKNLYNNIDEMGYFDPEDVKEQAATSGSKMGKVLVIRFHWYKPLKRSVTLEEIRRMDESFNPQRARTLSVGLFDSIVSAGNTEN